MIYQVSYKNGESIAIFQGRFLGMGFWHPISNQPEQGICKFDSIENAQKFIDYHLREAIEEWHREDFTIEPFDEKLNFEMQLAVMEEV